MKSHALAQSPLAAVVAIALFAALFAANVAPAHAARMQIPSLHGTLDALPVCHDFGCKAMTTVALSPSEWRSVADWFAPPAATPQDEREQIKRAIGWMEVVVGRHTPTHKDLAFDLPVDGDRKVLFPGQLDCIDEAVNTTTYLRLFESHRLLRHHRVMEAAYRRSLFDQHWAGQVREVNGGERFVIDSWFQPNGHLPIVQSGRKWGDINPLTAVVDNSSDAEGEIVRRSFWHRFLRGE